MLQLSTYERDYGSVSPMNGTGSRMVFASPAPVPYWDAAYSVAFYLNDGIRMNDGKAATY